MAALCLLEGQERVKAFADALEEGRLSLASPMGELQSVLNLQQQRLRPYRASLLAASSVRDLIISLRTSAETAARIRAGEPVIELVWTYPGSSRPGVRTTGGVAREIIASSRTSLLIVGYKMTVDPALTGLASQSIDAIAGAAARGVAVIAVLDRDANRHALLQAWRPGVPQPAVFTWPVSDDPKAAIHAKILVADRHDGLVTSTNLTYHGFERNLEFGIRVMGSVAGEIHDRVQSLIAAGELVPWGA